ncbi:MAG: hypothetical protein LBU32_14500 [Clostridiales bacterium]|nr:hypothetical protein [Clostridiales bacterium]
MAFALPAYNAPDFSKLINSPDARLSAVESDGILPDGYHATSIYPEYYKIKGKWKLAEDSRMDCVAAVTDKKISIVEARNVKKGDLIVIGRTKCGEEGIYLNANPFRPREEASESFAFRSGRTRETAFSMDYDNLYNLLSYEKDHGNILWVMGPAFAFDYDARRAMQALAENGFVHGILAGNALATHDLEAGFFKTALGQDIYSQKTVKNGHYHHLDIINKVRKAGSIKDFISEAGIKDGIMFSVIKNDIPYVLTGSIRDDGPLPEVISDSYEGQFRMRALVRKATTVICMATQLHAIATGNMTPCFRVKDGAVRPLYIYAVDISEFAVNKLADRGSLSAVSMVTNVQDFAVHLARGVIKEYA